MTQEEHKQRHVFLHEALDELIADWAGHTRQLFSEHTIMELVDWSHSQTLGPDCPIHGPVGIVASKIKDRRGRKGMSADQREEVSARMKKYWAGRRAIGKNTQ